RRSATRLHTATLADHHPPPRDHTNDHHTRSGRRPLNRAEQLRFTAWGLAAATGAALLWRAPTMLNLPVVQVLTDGTYLSLLIDPKVRGARREQLLVDARAGRPVDTELAHLVRVVEYDIPDRDGDGTGELVVLLTTLLDPADARADELADIYYQRWEHETANDQLKTHLRGPGRVLRSRLPDLAYQEIWAWLLVHYALAVLVARAAEAADIDPDRVSFTRTVRLARRTATGTADISP
ncbi:IS4 family transposase, partial [Parafrankia sp. FMc6]